MWTPYREDPWTLAAYPLTRRRVLSDVFVATYDDGVAVHKPVDGYDVALVSGAGAAEALASPEVDHIDRAMVMGPVAPEVDQALRTRGFEPRRRWDFFSLTEEPEPVPGIQLEQLRNTGEINGILTSSYPTADHRTTKGGRWWGVRRNGMLAAAGAIDTWRGAGEDGSIEWNSHLRSFVVHRDFRGEGLGRDLFRAILFEEWRRNGWVQWGSWADADDSQGLMAAVGVAPLLRVSNYRLATERSEVNGFPGSETI